MILRKRIQTEWDTLSKKDADRWKSFLNRWQELMLLPVKTPPIPRKRILTGIVLSKMLHKVPLVKLNALQKKQDLKLIRDWLWKSLRNRLVVTQAILTT